MSAHEVTSEPANRAYDRILGEMMQVIDRWDGTDWKEAAVTISAQLLQLHQIARNYGRATGCYQGEVFRLNNSVMTYVRQLRLVPGFSDGSGEVVQQTCRAGLDLAVDLQIALFGDVPSVDEV